jgi:hypothetical protein
LIIAHASGDVHANDVIIKERLTRFVAFTIPCSPGCLHSNAERDQRKWLPSKHIDKDGAEMMLESLWLYEFLMLWSGVMWRRLIYKSNAEDIEIGRQPIDCRGSQGFLK